MYFWGEGVAVDYPRAMASFKVAAEAGDAMGMWQVGAMYRDGLGVAKDSEQAFPWVEKAAAKGAPAAILGLASMVSFGLARLVVNSVGCGLSRAPKQRSMSR